MVNAALVLAAAASLVSASTPPGFEPVVSNTLVVQFGNTLVNGQVVQKNLTTSQPQIGTTRRLNGTSFAVIMVDLNIPTNVVGQTSTLLHWMQTGLTQTAQSTLAVNSSASSINSTAESVFFLRNATQAPAASYIGPSPPARIPLSHTYAQFLVDTSGMSTQSTAMTTLMSAAMTRQNFSVQQVLQRAGLSNKIVAANFFNVTNPGPVQVGSSTGNTTASSSSSSSPSSATSSRSSTTSSSSLSGSTTVGQSSTSASAVITNTAAPYSVFSGTMVVLLAGLAGLFMSL
ncbi:phosphatidylethanolamine-binding protein pebp [Ophiostoma piceae UAMH 11346]|uniref:Phosphatidylethanolamine-binding protein pebp n=1 Tax=Ophiostoma piceae (strain UAMH 11346) TaxID=1262450 RepID=S3CQP1_OPHP1|nr:phosphatidylethanolamine-binding protein pebp [Ophiostoma piceae UAMH 11346]